MASSPQHEPTMEEILASIRKIISEDSTEATAPTTAAPPPPESDVLELTQEMPADPMPQRAVAPAVPPKPENDVPTHTMEEPVVAADTPAADDGIFSEMTRKALDDTFSNIPNAIPDAPVEPRRAATRAGAIEGSTVEAVFERAVTNAVDPLLHDWMDKNKTDLLVAVKPLIREWMDEHFPALLEGAVRNEVERVVKARGNKR